MAPLLKIVRYLDTYLDIQSIKDMSWNGLQFEGITEVKKVFFAVDTGTETFSRAVKEGAQMIVVHHGLFWTPINPSYTGVNKQRLDILYKNNISLYACHLPLDKHKSVGNNAGIVSMVGAKISGEFGMYNGTPIGYQGIFKTSKLLSAIEKKLNNELNTSCTTLAFGPKKIKRVGVISGGCSHSHVQEAIDLNLDLIITGEQMDVYHNAKDAGLNVIFAGHHATEIVGVKLFAEHVKKKLNVKTVFVDIPTGL